MAVAAWQDTPVLTVDVNVDPGAVTVTLTGEVVLGLLGVFVDQSETNGKIERYQQTLATKWAYSHLELDKQRATALDNWVTNTITYRYHTAIDGPPISRGNNPREQYN